jgi:hypothetical protein
MGSEVERQRFRDMEPQGERGEKHRTEEEGDGQVASLLKDAGEGSDEEEVGEGFHGRRLCPPGARAQAQRRGGRRVEGRGNWRFSAAGISGLFGGHA